MRAASVISCGVRMPATTSSPCALIRNSPYSFFSPVDGLRVKATPVAEVSPILPNTMACTLTAVPQLSGMLCRRAIGDGALVHPRCRTPRRSRPTAARAGPAETGLPSSSSTRSLYLHDQIRPVVGGQIGVERVALAVLVVVEQLLEVLMVDAQHHVGIHGDEAAIAVIGEAPVARLRRQRLDGFVVEAEIEHGVHHARHRGARAGAHRNQQRVDLVAESLAGDLADLDQRPSTCAFSSFGYCLLVGVVIGADLGGDGEAGRHRQAEIGHLGEVGALAAEQIASCPACPRPCRRRRHKPIALAADRRLRLCRAGLGHLRGGLFTVWTRLYAPAAFSSRFLRVYVWPWSIT